MGIDRAHYHGWQGPLRSPWQASLAMVRVALLQVFRRKLYWVVLAVGLAQFLLYSSVIYGVTQFQLPRVSQQRLLKNFGFSAEARRGNESGYTRFIERQGRVVMILLAFSGSLLVGADFRGQALPFYLSRRIDRRHYIAGKLLATSTVVLLLTVVPALLLFVEYGMFTGSTDYWRENLHVPASIVIYGLVLCGVLSVLLAAVSAWVQRLVPIAVLWAVLFVLLGPLGAYLSEATGQEAWRLVDLWKDMHRAAGLLSGNISDAAERWEAQRALAVLAVISGAALAALVRRVRAVEVVS